MIAPVEAGGSDAVFLPLLSTVFLPHESEELTRHNCRMEPVDVFLERLEQLSAERQLKEQAVSVAATGSKDRIRNARRNRSIPKSETIDQLAAFFGVSNDYLLGRSDVRSQRDIPPGNAIVSDRTVSWRGEHGAEYLKIVGTALGHSLQFDDTGGIEIEETILEPTEVIRHVPRPQALVADKGAYAVYIQGDSMSMRYEPGDLAVVSTLRPPQLGDDVIVQLTDVEGSEIISALIKRLVRRSASWVELRQFNPECTFRVPAARVRHIHRVMRIGDILGA